MRVHRSSPMRLLWAAAVAAGMVTAANTQSRPTPGPDACTVLSKDELAKIVGRADFGRARPDTGPNGESSCRYSSSRGSVTLSVSTQTRAEFEKFRKLLSDEGKKPETVEGVGDAAYFWDDDALYALSGKLAFRVFISKPPNADSAKIRADLLALARAVVAKLKG